MVAKTMAVDSEELTNARSLERLQQIADSETLTDALWRHLILAKQCELMDLRLTILCQDM